MLEYRDRIDVEHLEGQHIPGGLELFRHLMTTAALNTERRGIVQAYAVLTGESVTDGHPAADWVTERFSVLRDEIATALQQVGRERGVEIGEREAGQAASAVIGVMDGLQVQWLLEPDAVDLADSTAFAIEAILAAALAGADAPRTVPAT